MEEFNKLSLRRGQQKHEEPVTSLPGTSSSSVGIVRAGSEAFLEGRVRTVGILRI